MRADRSLVRVHLAAIGSGEFDVAELALRLRAGGFVVHARGDELRDAHLEMERQFGVDVACDCRARAPGPLDEAAFPRHGDQAGLRTFETAAAYSCHTPVSARSCVRPAVVML